MKIALDPYMLRDRPFGEVCRIAADIGYDSIELSPRTGLHPVLHPPAGRPGHGSPSSARPSATRASSCRRSCRCTAGRAPTRTSARPPCATGSEPSSCASTSAARTMNSEFNGRPEQAARSEAQFWRSLEELLPIFEREGIRLNLEAHPDDFIERNDRGRRPGPGDRLAARPLRLLRAAHLPPRRRHRGDDRATRRRSSPRSTSPTSSTIGRRPASATSSTRRAPRPGSTSTSTSARARWTATAFFGALRRVGFDGILTSCVFAWEERAVESSRLMFERIKALLAGGSAPA